MPCASPARDLIKLHLQKEGFREEVNTNAEECCISLDESSTTEKSRNATTEVKKIGTTIVFAHGEYICTYTYIHLQGHQKMQRTLLPLSLSKPNVTSLYIRINCLHYKTSNKTKMNISLFIYSHLSQVCHMLLYI